MTKIVTHNGNFHADDIFAVATLLLVHPGAQVVRSRNDEEIKSADIVVDVGLVYDPTIDKFDHHQTDGAGKRENGIPYASFGLVWRKYGSLVARNDEAAKMIEDKLVVPIDALDNGVNLTTSIYSGVRPYDISDYLYSYWITDDVDDVKIMEIFEEVVTLAKNLISREVQKANHIIEEGKIVEEIYNNSRDRRLIIMNKHHAWGKVLVEKPEPLLVVYPDVRGADWRVKTVRKSNNTFERRITLPSEWGGKSGEELAKITGIKDATFCHRGLFLAGAKSKEGALELAQKALNA